MADGKINPSEVGFIQKLAKRMDISDREIVAIFENHQQADGSIRLPKALIPYMGGQEVIPIVS